MQTDWVSELHTFTCIPWWTERIPLGHSNSFDGRNQEAFFVAFSKLPGQGETLKVGQLTIFSIILLYLVVNTMRWQLLLHYSLLGEYRDRGAVSLLNRNGRMQNALKEVFLFMKRSRFINAKPKIKYRKYSSGSVFQMFIQFPHSDVMTKLDSKR